MKSVPTLLHRLPFTLTMRAGLFAAALVTNTAFQTITHHWLNRLGFAPNDLWYRRLERIVTSAWVTSGGISFWQAVFFIAFAVGLAEWLTGWKRAALTFWGIHFLTLILLSFLLSLAGDSLRSFGLEASQLARDVGPSAGYFACLGLVSARLKHPWNWMSGGVLLLGFAVALTLPPGSGESAAVKFSADLAHLIAFPFGWLSAGLGSRQFNQHQP